MTRKSTLTPTQARHAAAYFERTKDIPGIIKFEMDADGQLDIANDDGNASAYWMEQLGLTHGEELTALLQHIANQAPNKNAVALTVNRTLASIAAMGPRDSTELMLCCQMVAIHNATMRVAGQSPPTFESVGIQSNALAKLSRTYTAQMEALTRYRSRGQQKIKVEHIHVHEGGQVAVGNFGHQGGGAVHKNEDQPHVRTEAAEFPERQTMLGHIETFGLTLQGASGDGLERMPVSRSEGWGAEG